MPILPLSSIFFFFFLTLIVRLFINNGTKEVGRCENNVTRVFTFGPQLNSHADVFNFRPHLSPLTQNWTQFNYFCINCEFFFKAYICAGTDQTAQRSVMPYFGQVDNF